MAAMRIVIFVVGIFVFVAADLSINGSSSLGGWLYHIAALARTSGVM